MMSRLPDQRSQTPPGGRPAINIRVVRGGVSLEMNREGAHVTNAGLPKHPADSQRSNSPISNSISVSVPAYQNNISTVTDPGQIYQQQNVQITKVVSPQKGGSNYSSPRSSLGSYDSKGSSPRSSMVSAQQPPLPFEMHQRHGSPHSSLASPRSSISALSVDSKHSSPRSSITGISNLMYDRYPSPRSSVERYINVGSPQKVTVEHHVSGAHDIHISPHHMGPRPPAGFYNRFNEHAPPPPYDARMRVQAFHLRQGSPSFQVQIGSPVGQGIATGTIIATPSPPQSNQSSPGLPNTASSSIVVNVSGSNQLPHNIPIQRSEQPAIPKLRGLNYDVVPPKHSGPSEAEKKLAALTQQFGK